jgi:hypothetical protein
MAARVVGGGGEEPLVVGVAADDPVQDDDVGWWHGVGCGGDVDLATGDPVAHPGGSREVVRGGVVGVDELEVRGVSGSATEQLELDVADAASDLQDRRVGDAVVDDELGHPGGGLVQAAFAVAGGEVPSEPGPEDVVASAWIAASAHVWSIRQGRAVGPAPYPRRVDRTTG